MSEELTGDEFDLDEDGVAVLRQDFEVPPDALAVRMQVGGAPVTVIGWIEDSESLPDLLRKVADECASMLAEREGRHRDPSS